MLRTVKPKNARSKRAMDARAPKEVEDTRTAIFVRGTHTGEKINGVMRDFMALKRPNCISFSKKNTIRPFDADSTSESSLEFWSAKNDASLFLIGQSTKKRPDGLTFVRMYDGRVLDMCEVGVVGFQGLAEFKTPKSTPGHKPLMHFASELFETHARFIQLKSLLLDFFNGEVVDSICLAGLEHVISVSLSPTPSSLNTTVSAPINMYPGKNTTITAPSEDTAALPKVHIRAYTIKLLSSGTRIPRVELIPMGPSIDLVLRRNQAADHEMWKQAMKRPKIRKADVEKGLGRKGKRKNAEVDEMGDLRGRVHVGRQELSGLTGRKMKGLRKGAGEEDGEEAGESGDWEGEGRSRKRQKA